MGDNAKSTEHEWQETHQSVGQFLNSVRALRNYWRLEPEHELWFRGERKAHGDTKLCPQLYRPRDENQARRPIPELLKIEDQLFGHFKRCGYQLCDVQPEDDWDWYFLMQHHGAPTRILDWSDGALIGLHFAVRDTPLQPTQDAIVYVLQPYWLVDYLKTLPDHEAAREKWRNYCREHPTEEFSEEEWDLAYLPDDEDWRQEVPIPRVPLLWDTAHTTRRFGAQRSRFMLFGTDPEWMREIASKQDAVKALAVGAGAIPAIKQELRDAGVTESVIFPDLDGLGREVKQLWEERR